MVSVPPPHQGASNSMPHHNRLLEVRQRDTIDATQKPCNKNHATNSASESEPARRFITCPANQSTASPLSHTLHENASTSTRFQHASTCLRHAQRKQLRWLFQNKHPNLSSYSRPHAHDPVPNSMLNSPGVYGVQSVYEDTPAFTCVCTR